MAIAAPRRGLEVTARDRRILRRAQQKLRGARVDFGEAVRALREAVEESIPNGRIYLLGMTEAGPILGSLVSGVGIAEGVEGAEGARGRGGIQVVRVGPGGRCTPLGSFRR